MTATAPAPKLLRASHRRVLQLFRQYGPSTDQELYEAAKAEGWDISPSGLRSRRAELSPPRGAGVRDSQRKRKTQIGVRSAVIWELDDTVADPYAGRA